MSHIQNKQKGTTLLDVVFGTALLLIVFVGLYGVFQLTLELVQSSKSKTGALTLASERMEFIRSLNYDDVGTVGGIPQGVLTAEENNTLNGIPYTKKTFVQYVDAVEDGVGGSDSNGITTDYKLVKVTIEWLFRGDARSFSLVTNVTPQGIESVVGGGTLRINVLDSYGSPVPSAQVNLINNALNPSVSVSTFSNISGVVEFPGAPSSSSYEISISKSGLNSAQTYSVGGLNVNPNPGHLTVVEAQTTSSTFYIDTTGSATVRTFEAGTTTPLQSIDLSIAGNKTIGTDGIDDPIYKYSSDINTGSLGSILLEDLEWDNYTITIDSGATGYEIAQTCEPQPFALAPSENKVVDMHLTDSSTHYIIVDVTDSIGNDLGGANVRLYNGGYNTTFSTDDCGLTSFSNSSSWGSYSIDVSLSGYTPQTVNSVDASRISNLSIVLNSI